jgi:hypothetical protein
MNKKFLFVAGCARSGTSAIVQLLSGSKEILLGMERYGHLVRPQAFHLKKKHFTKERFYSLEEEDTFYSSLRDFHKFDPHFFEKYESSKWIGDKRPDLYEVYDDLFENFPDAKVLFIYREIEAVASSFHGRVAEGNNWPASKNFARAVVEWNRSLFLSREAIRKGHDIVVLEYDELFSGKMDARDIFNYLDVEITSEVEIRIEQIIDRSRQLQSARRMLLSDDELNYVEKNAKKFLVDEISKSRLSALK